MGSLLGSSFVTAQDDSKKAVLAFSIDYDALMKSKIFASVGGVKGFTKLTEMDEDSAKLMESLGSMRGYFTVPKSIDPMDMVQTDFLLVMKMKNKESVDRMISDMSEGFVEVVRNGKTVLQADGLGAPPIFARQDGLNLVIASESGLFRKPESFMGDDLKKLFAKQQNAPIKFAANFDGARDFLSELSAVAGRDADFMTKQYVKLLDQISTVEIAGMPDDKTLYLIRLVGHNEKENKKIKLSVDAAVGLLKGFAEIGLATIEEEEPEVAELATAMLKELKVAGDAEQTTVTLSMPANFTEVWRKALGQIKEQRKKASRLSDANNLKMCALALHNYHDVYRQFPFRDATNLSWRVYVLPFMEEEFLFEKFDMKKKWSDDQNRKLIGSCPEWYQLSNGSTISFIKPERVPKKFTSILDGTSNTLMLIEDRKSKMTPWTKPAGVTPDEVVKMVKNLEDGDTLLAAFYDGSVQKISNKTPEKVLRRLCDPQDGESVSWEDIK